MNELKPWNGSYRKSLYLLRDINGEEFYCYPKDGKMIAIDGSGYYWVQKDNAMVREASWSEIFKDRDTVEIED